MAITTISGKQKDNNHGGYDMYSQVFTDIDNSYDWIKTVRSSDGYTDDCYITDNLYLRLAGENIGRTYAKFNVIVCGTFGTKTLYSRDLTNMYVTWRFTKTSKGFAFQLSSSSSGYDDNLDYKFYVGEITKLDGTTAQGCIYTVDDGTLTIATDSGISVENAYNSTITNDRMAVLVPIVNSTTGDVFNDIFAMRYSPIQYNKMFIPETDKKYLCGKNICIAD